MCSGSASWGHRHACFSTIDSTTSEMSSNVLRAPSIASIDVLPPQDLEGVELAAEQAGEDAPVDGVALALETVDRVEVRLHVLHRLEPGDEQPRLLARICTTRSACSFSSGSAW